MNISKEQQEEILRLRAAGFSYDKIMAKTGVSKPFVYAVCNPAVDNDALNGIEPAPVAAYVHKTAPQDWRHSGTAELEYKDRRIKDLEQTVSELKSTLNKKDTDLATLEKEHSLLLIDHKSVEQKHQYQMDNLINQHQYKQTTGLSGFADKVFSNDKVIETLMLGIAAKLGAAPAAPAQQTLPDLHPLINDPHVGTLIKEIYEVFKTYNANDIEPLHTLFGAFLAMPGLLKKTSDSAVAFIEKAKQTPPKNDNLQPND
jgi:hypothetical protein